MKITKLVLLSSVRGGSSALPRALVLALAITLTGTFGSRAADEAAVQQLLAAAKAKETRAQQLRAAASAAEQKAADDQMEAGAEERDARIFEARALKLLGADPNKQRAFNLRHEASRVSVEAQNMLVSARNAEQRAAQHTRNAEELRKAAAELKDQPATAATLESEAKDQAAKALTEADTASREKFAGQAQETRAKTALAEAEKLDPETQRQLAPASPKPVVVEPRQVK
jgi:hypothetical protein